MIPLTRHAAWLVLDDVIDLPQMRTLVADSDRRR